MEIFTTPYNQITSVSVLNYASATFKSVKNDFFLFIVAFVQSMANIEAKSICPGDNFDGQLRPKAGFFYIIGTLTFILLSVSAFLAH